MLKRSLTVLFIIISFTACTQKTITTGSFIKLVSNEGVNQTVKSPEEIQIFYKKTPDSQFTEVGIVEAIARGHNAGLKDLFPELKKQAAQLGSDAVYKIELQRTNQISDSLHATGIGIIFKTKN